MCQVNHPVSFDFAEQKFPTGMHICHLYNDENERQHTIAQFIQSGLLAGEKIGYLADVMPSTDDMDTLSLPAGDCSFLPSKAKAIGFGSGRGNLLSRWHFHPGTHA